MRVLRDGGRVEIVEVAEPVELDHLEGMIDDGIELFLVAGSDPDESGERQMALVLLRRCMVLTREAVDGLIWALIDQRVELWGPSIELWESDVAPEAVEARPPAPRTRAKARRKTVRDTLA